MKKAPQNTPKYQISAKSVGGGGGGGGWELWASQILAYASAKIQVMTNGFLTDEIEITRGVRQEDPLSARLYVILAEVLGNQIRSNQSISGITIRNIEQKILQYADDTQIIVSSSSSKTEIFKQLRLYEEATGAKINIGKTVRASGKIDMTNLSITNGPMIKFSHKVCG